MNLPESYIPILIQAGVAIGFVAISLLGAHFLGPQQKKGNSVKNSSWECGIPVEGNARTPFSIKYFLTAVLFVLFDIEIVFFYPYAVNFRELGWEGFIAVAMFVGFFLTGFIYIFKKGALKWEE